MFGISYDTWKSVCDMYFSLKNGTQKAYLQWFPFTKLSSADKESISGVEFYNSYIDSNLRKPNYKKFYREGTPYKFLRWC